MEKQKSFLGWLAMAVAVAALIVGLMTWLQASKARNLALSELEIQERDALSTPLLDQGSGDYGYVSIYDISITNVSGPAITLEEISKLKDNANFVVTLSGEKVVTPKTNPSAFLPDVSINEIEQNPKLLREMIKEDIGESAAVSIKIEPGQTKSVRVGVYLEPYDAEKQPVANVVLTSFRLEFDNGKSYVFRRGFPVLPIAN